MSTHYYALIDEVCSIHGINDAGDFTHGAHIVVAGIPLTLLPGAGADSLLLFCDFGKPPEQWRAEVLQRVLESNLFMFAADSPHFSMDHETGHVMLLERMAPSRIDADVLLGKLEQYAQHALRWQANFCRLELGGGTGLHDGLSNLTLPVVASNYTAGGKQQLM